MSDMQQLDLVLKGLKRKTPRGADTRLPITPLILRKILYVLRLNPQSRLNITMWAVCCLGYFAFLRSGEFTVPSRTSFDPAVHLTAADISAGDHTSPSLLRVVLKQSKTDQSREGVALFVGRTHNELCPVAGMFAEQGVGHTTFPPS